jgi:serine/threonine-protein kinase RsbW
MVGWEGFSSEALTRLSTEGVWSTDGVQLRILRDIVEDKAVVPGGVPTPIKEFEIMLPNKTRSELVAAGAAEQIAEEIGFDEDTVVQIKTAVVEACINAFEHARVREGKVQVRFVAGSDRLAIHVRNTGGVFDRPPSEPEERNAEEPPHKRGWGITFMRRLMDEVRFDKLSRGTSLVMVKYLKRNGEEER